MLMMSWVKFTIPGTVDKADLHHFRHSDVPTDGHSGGKRHITSYTYSKSKCVWTTIYSRGLAIIHNNLLCKLPKTAQATMRSSLGQGLACIGILVLVSTVQGFTLPNLESRWFARDEKQTIRHLSTSSSSSSSAKLPSNNNEKSSNWDESGKCKFGKKSYWDSVYQGDGANGADIPSEAYSWYCGYNELKPFWNMLVEPLLGQRDEIQVLVAGIGNDIAPVELYDDGWTKMIAFDYSQAGVDRAKELFGARTAVLMQADARELPLDDGTVNVVFDKGTLDAIYITGKEEFQDSVKELTRVTDLNGVFVCVSAVIPPETLLNAFDNNDQSSNCWETILDGGLAFAPDGEATIDLGAQLYAFRRL